MSSQSMINNNTQPIYDRTNDLKAFDDRKTGVKGLVDEGAEKIPSIFVRPNEDLAKEYTTCNEKLSVPVIDLAHANDDEYNNRASVVVKEIISASEKWGFFQVVNHGVALDVLDGMIEGIRMFHEQDTEIKKHYYTRDSEKSVLYNTNYDFYKSKAANWRDSLNVNTMFTGGVDPQELPPICREQISEYTTQVTQLADHILKLISMGLGLKPEYLQELQCTRAWNLVCHYYPACPEPDLTLGASKHSDPSFITILLQDHIGGLQVLHRNQWVNVEPVPGALIVNIGDILQIMSNDKLQSVYHRVIANRIGPRISIPIFMTGLFASPKTYGPIIELLSDENPPIYRDFTLREFFTYFLSRPLNQPGIEYFALQTAEIGNCIQLTN